MTTNPQKRTTGRLPSSANSGREGLQRALSQGKDGFRLQLRYLLMISQVQNPRPAPNEAPRTINLTQSRLEILAQLSPKASPVAREKLLKDILSISEPSHRWSLLAKAISGLNPKEAEPYANQIWTNAAQIANPILRANAMFDIAPLMGDERPTGIVPTALGRVVVLAQAMKNAEARIRGLVGIAPYLPIEQGNTLLKVVLTELASSKNDTLITKSLITFAPNIPTELAEITLNIAKSIKSPADRARALTAIAPYIGDLLQGVIRTEAMVAIDKIENEDERAEALMAFSPFLESASPEDFPKLLEQALTTTILITRRPLRARMLVSLAPHLTADLQGEAIAAVHGLTSERERASLLTQLAPTLPTNMLVASLAVAYTMREQDSRVLALSVLARYAPDNAKSQTILDALAAASNLPNHFERIQTLIDIMDILPTELRDQAINNAMDSIGQIENESARARAINLMGGRLPENLLVKALEIARELKNFEQRLNALLGIVSRLPAKYKTEAVQDMLACVVGTTLEYKRARSLVSIATHVTQEELQQVEALASTLTDPIDGFNVYNALIQHLSPDQRPPLITKAWSLLQKADVGYDKASAMSAFAPFASPDIHGELVLQVIPTIEAIEDEYDKASAMAILAPLLVGEKTPNLPIADRWNAIQRGLESALSVPFPAQRAHLLERGTRIWTQTSHPERAFAVWQVLVKRMINLPMAEVLQCLGALIPLISDFAGEEGLIEVAHLLGMR